MKLLTAGIGVALSMNATNVIIKMKLNRESAKKNGRNVLRNKTWWQNRGKTTSTGAPLCLTAAAYTATTPSTRPTPSSTLSTSRTSARLRRRQSAGRGSGQRGTRPRLRPSSAMALAALTTWLSSL